MTGRLYKHIFCSFVIEPQHPFFVLYYVVEKHTEMLYYKNTHIISFIFHKYLGSLGSS